VLVEEALSLVLRANAELVALVAGRIYPNVLPQVVTYPAISYRLVSRRHIDQLSNRGSTGLASSRFRFFSTSDTGYAQVKRVAEALRLCLQGYRGTVSDGGSPAITLYIQNIEPMLAFDFYDDPTQTHQVISDFEVWAQEQQPTP
jgi:hypothetical protein